jgi:tRNA(Ile)-lysidine synthase
VILKVKTYIETHKLLSHNEPVIVGFSGGSDSVSLLHLLHKTGYTCIAAHCNFHLRGDESERDEEFCRVFSETLKVKFIKTDFDTTDYASINHISVEMAARELRYEWFEKIRRENNAQAIAVAHHKDDSVETFLLNLVRGTGIRGLSGIKSKNGNVVRPLLCVNRNEIIKFIDDEHLDYVEDSTNSSDKYKRNFIRNRVIPLLEELNPSVKEAIHRTSEHIAETEAIFSYFLESAKKELIEIDDASGLRIDINKLMNQPASKTLLFELLQPYGFTRIVTDEIYQSFGNQSGKIFLTPDSTCKLLKDRNKLIIYKTDNKLPEEYKLYETGVCDENIPIKLSVRKVIIDGSFEISKDKTTAVFDYDKLHFPLTIRQWRHGDRFVPFGMKGSKKLSDYFTDNKTSIHEKEKTMVICSDNAIIWIVGQRTDNRFRIENNTKTAFFINFLDKNCDN